VKAVTRGDGFQGDDVTANIKTIRSIPLSLKSDFVRDFEIRGEIILPLDGFKRMNKQRLEEGRRRIQKSKKYSQWKLEVTRQC